MSSDTTIITAKPTGRPNMAAEMLRMPHQLATSWAWRSKATQAAALAGPSAAATHAALSSAVAGDGGLRGPGEAAPHLVEAHRVVAGADEVVERHAEAGDDASDGALLGAALPPDAQDERREQTRRGED